MLILPVFMIDQENENCWSCCFNHRDPHKDEKVLESAKLITFWGHPGRGVEFPTFMEGEFVIPHVDPGC